MEENYIKLAGLPDWFEWNPTTQDARTLDRKVPSTSRNGKPYMKTARGADPLPWYKNQYGRPFVRFKIDGKQIYKYKYELIWMAHHKRPIPRGYQIHHVDFNWRNNDISNLQLLTEEAHRKIHGSNEKAVVAVDENGNVVHRFQSANSAGRNGFSQSAVSCACRGRYNCKNNPHYYKGYYWYYEQE